MVVLRGQLRDAWLLGELPAVCRALHGQIVCQVLLVDRYDEGGKLPACVMIQLLRADLKMLPCLFGGEDEAQGHLFAHAVALKGEHDVTTTGGAQAAQVA